jgi:dolichyl-phosphate beta-glucosyltransferase
MPSLSIIIPCYNEEKRLNIEKVEDFLNQNNHVSIVFVNDGSTDRTAFILEQISKNFPQKTEILSNASQKGKAESVRAGMLKSVQNADINYHGFMDADMALSFKEFERLFKVICPTEKKFIFGSRIKKIGSDIRRNEWRHFYSRIIATILGFITKMNVYDTQCSAKIFRREIIPQIFGEKFKTKWLFDAEIICRIFYQFGDLNKSGIEEPVVEWTEIKGSKLTPANFFSIVKEILVINKYYRYHESSITGK